MDMTKREFEAELARLRRMSVATAARNAELVKAMESAWNSPRALILQGMAAAVVLTGMGAALAVMMLR